MHLSQKIKPTFLLLLLPFGGTMAQMNAGSDPEPLVRLSLQEALALVSEQNPTLVAQTYEERAANALVEQAGFRPSPVLGVSLENFAGTGIVEGISGLEATVQVSQTIERGGKRDKRVTLALREGEALSKAIAAKRNDILAATATAYVETLAAQRRLALAQEPLRLARETVSAVNDRLQAGAASPAEGARARVGLALAESEYARAEAALNNARTHMAALWGGAADEVPFLGGTLRVPDLLPSRDAALADLIQNPRLDLQQTLIAKRRAALELEQAQAVQDISVEGGIRFIREGADAAFVTGISIPFPLRNRNQGNIRAARESLTGAEHGVRALQNELLAQFSSAWQDLSAFHTAVKTLTSRALPATEEAYQTVRDAYDQGQLPLIDVLDAQRALVAIRREILDAKSDYATAQARIDSLTDPHYRSLASLISQP